MVTGKKRSTQQEVKKQFPRYNDKNLPFPPHFSWKMEAPNKQNGRADDVP
jgi:hypothetical protein